MRNTPFGPIDGPIKMARRGRFVQGMWVLDGQVICEVCGRPEEHYWVCKGECVSCTIKRVMAIRTGVSADDYDAWKSKFDVADTGAVKNIILPYKPRRHND